MSADGDTVRAFIATNCHAMDDAPALAALARLEAAKETREVWREVERKLSALRQQYDALIVAARVTSHGDHDYDPDAPPRTDCFLCAAIESRFRPGWMEEPYHWLRDPVVIDKDGSPKYDRRYDMETP